MANSSSFNHLPLHFSPVLRSAETDYDPAKASEKEHEHSEERDFSE